MRPARCSPRRTTRRSTTASRCASRARGRSGATPASPTSRRMAEKLLRRAGPADDRAAGASSTCWGSGPTTSCRSSTSASLRPLKVVADTANGMGGLVVPIVFDRLPVRGRDPLPRARRHVPQPSGRPDPAGEPGRAQRRPSSSYGADIGLAFDGDADRVFLVDEKAEPVSGSLTTALVAASMLTQAPGRDDPLQPHLLARRARGRHRAGRHPGADAGRATPSSSRSWPRPGAIFGGEHSGHYYYRDNFRADSGIITALVVLELLCQSGSTLSEMLEPYQRYADSGEINTEVADPAATVAAIAEAERASGCIGRPAWTG